MTRRIILDTYFGEGKLYGEKQHFDGAYVKSAHGAFNYFNSTGKAKTVTEQIIGSAYDNYGSVGLYTYPIALDPYTGKQQAEAFLESVDYVENTMGVPVPFVVLDFERAGNVDSNGNYLGKYAVKTKEIAEIVSAERKNTAIYCGPHTYRELFMWWAHVWRGYQDEFPLIIAQYNYTYWDKELEHIPENDKQPWLLPEIPRENVIMWQYSDKFPAGDFFPDSAAADVNVWLKSEYAFCKFFGKSYFSMEEILRRAKKMIDKMK